MYCAISDSGSQFSAFQRLSISMKPNLDGCPYFCTWNLFCAWPCRYMLRAYQSPCSGTHCADQCAQMPNFASRNQLGARYCLSESQVGWNGPEAIERAAVEERVVAD